MTEFAKIIQEHRERYPRMEPQDYGKLAYQSEFGPEHLVQDGEFVLRYLEQERAELSEHCPAVPPEPIGNGLCRVYLSNDTDLPTLGEAFFRSAQEHKGTPEGLERRLALLETLDVPGMTEWLVQYRAVGCPALRHSQTYRDAYHPHYRVVKAEYAEQMIKK